MLYASLRLRRLIQCAVDPCAQAHIKLLPGLGHTASTPFDRDYGWYRYPRCLSGWPTYTRVCSSSVTGI
eukprot:SAG31_NODE_23651_length_499_cov_1.030000_1_plen_69_part_00